MATHDKQVNITMDDDMARAIDEWGREQGFAKVNDFRVLIMKLGHSCIEFDFENIGKIIKKINPAADLDNPQLSMFDKMKAQRNYEVAKALSDITAMSFADVQRSIYDARLEKALMHLMHNSADLVRSKVGVIKLENGDEVHAVLYPTAEHKLEEKDEIAGIFKEG